MFDTVPFMCFILHTASQEFVHNSGTNHELFLFPSAMAVESFTAVSPNVQVGSFVLSKGKNCFVLTSCLLLAADFSSFYSGSHFK